MSRLRYSTVEESPDCASQQHIATGPKSQGGLTVSHRRIEGSGQALCEDVLSS